MAGPQPHAITVSVPQQAVLERLLRQHSCPQALALRVRIVLGAATGRRNEPLAAQLACSPLTVRKWRARWAAAQARLAAAEADPAALATMVAATLADAPRPGTPHTFSADWISAARPICAGMATLPRLTRDTYPWRCLTR
jgi:hypothetical protein